MNYHLTFLSWLKAKGKMDFTHKDILEQTTANCSYDVVRSIKRTLAKENCSLTETIEERTRDVWNPDKKKTETVTKRYKRYFIIKHEKDNNLEQQTA